MFVGLCVDGRHDSPVEKRREIWRIPLGLITESLLDTWPSFWLWFVFHGSVCSFSPLMAIIRR
jgi:hypothetical protein